MHETNYFFCLRLKIISYTQFYYYTILLWAMFFQLFETKRNKLFFWLMYNRRIILTYLFAGFFFKLNLVFYFFSIINDLLYKLNLNFNVFCFHVFVKNCIKALCVGNYTYTINKKSEVVLKSFIIIFITRYQSIMKTNIHYKCSIIVIYRLN